MNTLTSYSDFSEQSVFRPGASHRTDRTDSVVPYGVNDAQIRGAYDVEFNSQRKHQHIAESLSVPHDASYSITHVNSLTRHLRHYRISHD